MSPTLSHLRILTNGRLRSYVTPHGQGGLFRDWVALTRFNENKPLSNGPEIYARDGSTWAKAADLNPAELAVELQVGIDSEADLEIRKIVVTNRSSKAKTVELTTYAEVSLNHPQGDAGHPAFSKLFVQTSFVAGKTIILARRRPRGLNENWPWLGQRCIAESSVTWETNRATFLGRGRSTADPICMGLTGALSCEVGNVLDPVLAWRCSLDLLPNQQSTVWLMTAAGEDEDETISLLDRCADGKSADLRLAAAIRQEAQRLKDFNITEADALRHSQMLAEMHFGSRSMGSQSLAGSDVLARFPLSPDEFRIIARGGLNDPGTPDLLVAAACWKSSGVHGKIYHLPAEEDRADALLSPTVDVTFVDPATLSREEMDWLIASAQLIVGKAVYQPDVTSPPEAVRSEMVSVQDAAGPRDEVLRCPNGFGGFSEDGREYVIRLDLINGRLRLPPMPWVNVLANPVFGCVVTERGSGYTWARNSQANRLTPWSNDPISDPYGEAFYLMDHESGRVWSPLPGPCPPMAAFEVRHGFGRSRFTSEVFDIRQTVDLLVAPDAPVKIVSFKLENLSAHRRSLTFASYHQIIIGSSPDRHHATVTWADPAGVQHARNPRAGDFAEGHVFSTIVAPQISTCRRRSCNSTKKFRGHGGIECPDSLQKDVEQSPTSGFGHDACFGQIIEIEIGASSTLQFHVLLGEALDEPTVVQLVREYGDLSIAAPTIDKIDKQWRDYLCSVQIKTPVPEIDLMVNGWLLYQNLACRIWGRSAFYQSGGAYGFRDQLQDSGAFAGSHPEIMRQQILLHAAQQFPEGDVTHWWHPAPMNRGMRTNFSDDLLWLPYLTEHYLQVSGDPSVLEEVLPFIEGPLLGPGEDEEYMKPEISNRVASVYEHCCLALDRSLTCGANKLPLMGIGDWNDGMSRIGREGRGESVWLGFFLYEILGSWIPLCESRGDTSRSEIYSSYRDALYHALNAAGWDGAWYRRAYYDNGAPLGTHSDSECRIDALAQAWAVISGAAPVDRANLAMDSLMDELVDPERGIIRLLDPPFVNTPHDPGYIKGYVAGVRENGGQYTHAACWVIRAVAELGRRDEACELMTRLSPIWHSRDEESIARYQVEPYVVAADIYGAEPHVGRGGWTWYTGSAGWMHRVAVESLLGFRIVGGREIVVDPRIPNAWPEFRIDYRIDGTFYKIHIANPTGDASRVTSLILDGTPHSLTGRFARWSIEQDGKVHDVAITLGV